MSSEKRVFKIESDTNHKIVLRYPEKEDAGRMHKYVNALSKEETFVNYQGEKISLKEEKNFLKEQLRRIKKGKSVQLLMLSGREVVGVASIDLGESTFSHNGELGISILKNFRDKGYGRELLDLIMKEAQKNLKNLKMVTLTLFSNNEKAYRLYKKIGFREYGRLPRGVFYNSTYYDRIYMFKNLSK